MNWILLILKLLPSILATVKAVEEVAPTLTGVEKKAIIIDAITPPNGATTNSEKSTKIVSDLIDSTVTSLNKNGLLSGVKK